MEGNKRVKRFPLESNSGFGKKKQKKTKKIAKKQRKNSGSQSGQDFK
jgi:hypothetical protein